MKCIRMGDKVVRVSNEKAASLVDSKQAVYVNKASWKKAKKAGEV